MTKRDKTVSSAPARGLVWLVASLWLCVHAVLALLVRQAGIGTAHDDAVYLALAQSLLELNYLDLFTLGEPPHHMYPPGYPALLALWRTIAGDQFDHSAILGIILSTSALAMLFSALLRKWSPSVALFCLIPLSVNPYLVDYAGWILSETPYMFFAIASLFFLTEERLSARAVIVASIFSIVAALTRTVGISLVIAIGIHFLLSRRYKAVMVFSITSMMTVGSWLVWTVVAPSKEPGSSYMAEAALGMDEGPFLTMITDRFAHHVAAYIGGDIPYRLPIPTLSGTPVDNVVGVFLLVCGLLLGWIVVYRVWRPAALYLLVYLAVLFVWPWQMGRFVVPIIPLLVPTFLLGLKSAGQLFGPRCAYASLLVASIVLTVNGAARSSALITEKAGCERGTTYPEQTCLGEEQREALSSFFHAAEYIRTKTPEDSVVLSSKPATLFYYTGRRNVHGLVSSYQGKDDFVSYLRRHDVQYVLLADMDHYDRDEIIVDIERHCSMFRVEAEFPPMTYLFRLNDGNRQGENTDACRAVEEYRKSIVSKYGEALL